MDKTALLPLFSTENPALRELAIRNAQSLLLPGEAERWLEAQGRDPFFKDCSNSLTVGFLHLGLPLDARSIWTLYLSPKPGKHQSEHGCGYLFSDGSLFASVDKCYYTGRRLEDGSWWLVGVQRIACEDKARLKQLCPLHDEMKPLCYH